jgi:hypothetical protein
MLRTDHRKNDDYQNDATRGERRGGEFLNWETYRGARSFDPPLLMERVCISVSQANAGMILRGLREVVNETSASCWLALLLEHA